MNANLIGLLSKLEESEFKTIVRFAKSPYHNSNKLIIELLKELLAYYPNFKHKRLTKEFIYRKIHSEGTEFHEGRMNVLMSQLVKLIERFFMYQEFESDELLKKKMQVKAFQERDLYQKYKKKVDEILTLLENLPFKDEKYFYHQYLIKKEFHFNIKTDLQKIGEQSVDSAMENLDYFYINAKLRLINDLITRSKKFNYPINILFEKEILTYSKEIDFKNFPVIYLYRGIVFLREFGYDKDYYNNIKTFFFAQLDKIIHSEQILIFSALSNYLLTNFNSNQEKFKQIIFNLYQLGIANNLILNNNRITTLSYMNIALISIGASKTKEDFAWCHRFILEYEKFLSPKDAKATKSIALARYFYVHGKQNQNTAQLEKAMVLINTTIKRRRKTTNYMKSATSLIYIYYELISLGKSYKDLLINHFNSFEGILKNDTTLAPSRKEGYLLFNKFAKKTFSLKNTPNLKKEKILDLKKELKFTKDVLLRPWLNEKIEELLDNSSIKKIK